MSAEATPADDGDRLAAARTRLAAAVRDLGHLSLGRDLDVDAVHDLADRVESMAASVRPLPARTRDPGDWFRDFFATVDDGEELVHFADCVVSGPQNPLGIGLRAWADGGEVVGRVTLRRAHEGAPGRGHGGVVAAVFDDAMGYLLTVHGIVAFTGELTVRYVAGTPIGVPLEIRAQVAERGDRTSRLVAQLRTDDEVVATGSGIFVEVRDTVVDEVRGRP